MCVQDQGQQHNTDSVRFPHLRPAGEHWLRSRQQSHFNGAMQMSSAVGLRGAPGSAASYEKQSRSSPIIPNLLRQCYADLPFNLSVCLVFCVPQVFRVNDGEMMKVERQWGRNLKVEDIESPFTLFASNGELLLMSAPVSSAFPKLRQLLLCPAQQLRSTAQSGRPGRIPG